MTGGGAHEAQGTHGSPDGAPRGGAHHDGRRQRVVIAGAGGLIGRALCASYRYAGFEVCRLVRREPATADERHFDPRDPRPALVDGADVLVNLAGSPLTGRWNAARREAVRTSRIGTTRALAAMVAAATSPPPVFLSASGIRWYGIDRGDEVLTEASDPGPPDGLLPTVAHEWERAAAGAAGRGVRVVLLRFGLVLGREGGVLKPLLPLFRAGLGMRFGTGREYWSHVSLADAVGAVRFLTKLPDADGAYNVTAPEPARNRDVAAALGRALHRPAVLRVPPAVLRPALGGIAAEVLGGLRVVPHRLTEAGFGFRHPDVDTAIRAALADG